MRMEDAMQAR